MAQQEESGRSKALWFFLLHTLTGLVVFAIIAAAAIGLSLAIKKCEAWEVDAAVLLPLVWVKWTLYVLDLALLGKFLVKQFLHGWREL